MTLLTGFDVIAHLHLFLAAPRNCSNGDVRLVGGDTYQGHVEVCLNGYWISVCSSSQWGVSEASIVCRQLGHTDNGELLHVL